MRTARITRTTGETKITLTLSLDGGPSDIHTGVGFFDQFSADFGSPPV